VKSFQYRLYPTRKQQRALDLYLDECRWLYNQLLEQRKTAWDKRQETIGLYDQHAQLPALKRERTSLTKVHSQVLQNVGVRIDRAFAAFFRRCRDGEKPGYPRFRGRHRYDKIEGEPKTVCVRRSATGKWYVTIACEWEPTPLDPTPEQVGIDVGLASFATFSTGEAIENPRFFRAEEKALAKAQRRLSKEAKGTHKRRKRRTIVARVHERTRFRRQNFAHQESRKIVNRFQVIAVEDLSVNPAYTSQDCSRCGHRQKMPLSDRTYRCPCCLLEMDRDLNAARNILRLGLQALGLGSQEAARP
jgi:putative transposase